MEWTDLEQERGESDVMQEMMGEKEREMGRCVYGEKD